MDKKKKAKRFKVFRFFCLFCYIICSIVLIIESAMDGKSSSAQSNAVGGTIAGIVNTVGGDNSESIAPTSLTIDNKIFEAKVGDKYQINTTILPYDSSYKSVEYTTSNNQIADITNEGLISFYRSGIVTINAINSDYKNIKDTMIVNVKNVEATNIITHIPDATKAGEVYKLYVGKSYQINTTILPENTTFKDITYYVSSNSYLTVSEEGLIKALSYSKNNIISIIVSSNNIAEEIKVVVDYENKVLLTDFKISQSSFDIVVTQTASIKVTPVPLDATFKDYKLVSNDTSIVSITSKNTFKGKKVGNTTISVISTTYQNIIKTIYVNVSMQPEITTFDIQEKNVEMEVGNYSTIKLTGIDKYADLNTISFKSNDVSIVTVNKKGQLKAIKEGTTVVVVKSTLQTINVNVTVLSYAYEDKNDTTIDFQVNYLKGIKPVVFVGSSYNLNDYFEAVNFEYENGIETENKEIVFSLDKYADNTGFLIINNVLTVSDFGEISLSMTHKASGISKKISMLAISNFDIQIDDNDALKDEYTYYPNQTIYFDVLSETETTLQNYSITIDCHENDNLAILTQQDNDTYKIDVSNYSGTFDIVVTPLYENIELSEYSKVYAFNIEHILTESLSIVVTDSKNSIISLGENNILDMYVNDKYYINTILEDNVTNYNIEISYSDPSILNVDSEGLINVNKIGYTTITFKDTITNISNSINVAVYNKILVDTENSLTFTGTNASYDETSNTYSLTNGNSGSIKINFLDETTYKNVTYLSSNEDVVTIGKDGTITPKKTGEAIITLICDDGMQEKIEIEIKIIIKPQPVIDNLSDFLYKIRKSVGHFGAFLVLGIFSTFTYLLYLRKWKWLISIPLNFALGFALASLTEYIQTFIPGRSGRWADVMIDFSGFLCSTILLTVIILLTYFLKFIIIKYKDKKTPKIYRREIIYGQRNL